MNNIIPARITEARESRALSMADLADLLGVTRQAISKYERGIMNPSMDSIQLLSHKLKIPIDFFYKANVGTVAYGSSIFFRANLNIAKKIKTACKYQVKWIDEIKGYLESFVDFPDREILPPTEDYESLSFEEIEQIALDLRARWGLGDRPIGDLIGILENHGIVVSQFAGNEFCSFKGIDAFSCWRSGSPYILYNPSQKSAVRIRFSILHELAHLLFHSDIPEDDAVKKTIVELTDNQADRFAAAFLLPATSFPKDVRGTSLSALEPVKLKWGASFSTIIRRCETLDILTDNQINYLKRQMTMQKFWHKEPLDDTMIVKGPEIIKDALLMLDENGVVSKDEFLLQTSLNSEEVEKMCFLPRGYFGQQNIRQKPVLKLVSSVV